MARARSWYTSLDESERYLLLILISVATVVMSSPIAWNYYDVHLFMLTWSNGLEQGWNVYEHSNSQYPPVATYLFIAFELLGRKTSENPLVYWTPLETINWIRMVARIPLMVGYFAAAHLIYQRWGWTTVRYWLFTPPILVTIFLTQVHFGFTLLGFLSWTSIFPLYTFWGYQFELLAVPLTLLSLFSLLDNKPYRFALYASIGAMIKLYPVILLPLALARFDLRQTAKAACVSISIAGVCFIPFLYHSPHDFYYQLFGFQGERYPQGMSIYHIPLLLVEYRIDEFQKFKMLKWVWQIVWLPVYGYLVYAGWRTDDDDSLTLITGGILLSFVMFNKIGNLNYILWFLPFLLFALDRGYVSWKYPTGLVATVSSFIFTIQTSAAIIGERILIIQELTWYESREIVVNSFRGIAYDSLISQLVYLNNTIGGLASAIYTNRFIITTAIILIHISILGGILVRFVSCAQIHQCKFSISTNPIEVVYQNESSARE